MLVGSQDTMHMNAALTRDATAVGDCNIGWRIGHTLYNAPNANVALLINTVHGSLIIFLIRIDKPNGWGIITVLKDKTLSINTGYNIANQWLQSYIMEHFQHHIQQLLTTLATNEKFSLRFITLTIEIHNIQSLKWTRTANNNNDPSRLPCSLVLFNLLA